MAYKKFKSNDIFHNTLEMHPQYDFVIYDGQIYLNNRGEIAGAHVTNAGGVPTGHVSLYELNVDRAASATPPFTALDSTGVQNPPKGLIYPWVIKSGDRVSFKNLSKSAYNELLSGQGLTGSYPMSASIVHQQFTASATSRTGSASRITSLKNIFNQYKPLSNHYAFNSSLGDKSTQELSLISIPSIIFGTSIKKGSVDLNFYVSGTLIGQLKDENRDGNLIQVGPIGSNGSGSVAGVVLYNEGFVSLTGSWDLGNGFPGEDYGGLNAITASAWSVFGAGANDGLGASTVVSSSFGLSFMGTTKSQTITMLSHAEKGEFNHSNNPTYRTFGQTENMIVSAQSSSAKYIQNSNIAIKNVVSSSYSDPYADFKKTTYISSVAIYDENRNLIGIAKLATPVKKTEDLEYTIKMKLDI